MEERPGQKKEQEVERYFYRGQNVFNGEHCGHGITVVLVTVLLEIEVPLSDSIPFRFVNVRVLFGRCNHD